MRVAQFSPMVGWNWTYKILFIQKIKIIFQEAVLNLSISQVGYAQLLKCSNASSCKSWIVTVQYGVAFFGLF